MCPRRSRILLRYWEHNVTVLRTVLPVTASDEEVFNHACSQVRRRTRQSECAHLSVLLQRAGENGLRNNVNFAERTRLGAKRFLWALWTSKLGWPSLWIQHRCLTDTYYSPTP